MQIRLKRKQRALFNRDVLVFLSATALSVLALFPNIFPELQAKTALIDVILESEWSDCMKHHAAPPCGAMKSVESRLDPRLSSDALQSALDRGLMPDRDR